MKTKIITFWTDLRSSFWFFPTLMICSATGLAFLFVGLDKHISSDSSIVLSWIYGGSAEGATAVLETIAGSMATITGVVFSMTLVALSLASSQFGPRLLRNFMRDTANQIVLGTFISTFLYCLLVLRTIRRPNDISFVPHLSVTLGVVLALASLCVLIYFIHHVAVSIQIDEIVAQVEKNLLGRIEILFPAKVGEEASVAEKTVTPPNFGEKARLVTALSEGYLQLIDTDVLLELSIKTDTVFNIRCRPGCYINAGSPLVAVQPRERVNENQIKPIADAFLLGKQRTSGQDIDFLLCQLVEIGVRALSPGINDPFTAMTCIDRLGSALSRLAQREMPSSFRFDEKGSLRLITPTVEYGRFVNTAFDQIREYGRGSTAVNVRLLETLSFICQRTQRSEDRHALRRQAEMIIGGARKALPEELDRRRVEEHYLEFCRVFENPTSSNRFSDP